jgi:hypothetical protein
MELAMNYVQISIRHKHWPGLASQYPVLIPVGYPHNLAGLDRRNDLRVCQVRW